MKEWICHARISHIGCLKIVVFQSECLCIMLIVLIFEIDASVVELIVELGIEKTDLNSGRVRLMTIDLRVGRFLMEYSCTLIDLH